MSPKRDHSLKNDSLKTGSEDKGYSVNSKIKKYSPKSLFKIKSHNRNKTQKIEATNKQ